jgi:hypothetical protein
MLIPTVDLLLDAAVKAGCEALVSDAIGRLPYSSRATEDCNKLLIHLLWIQTIKGKTFLKAHHATNIAVVKMLLPRAGWRVTFDELLTLPRAVAEDYINAFLDFGGVEIKDDNGPALLRFAIHSVLSVALVEKLISRGCKINKYVVRGRVEDCSEVLCAAINAPTRYKGATKRYIAYTRLLLEHRANPNLADSKTHLPYYYAMRKKGGNTILDLLDAYGPVVESLR